MFSEAVIRRLPESVALSAPLNATGVFEMVEQPEMLLPFEGGGVAANWLFELPRAANRIDYNTIADVLITLEYTALSNHVLRQRVIQEMSPETQAERLFSLRQHFPDQWYDLHHLPASPRTIRIRIHRSDFGPNVGNDIRIRQISLFALRKEGISAEMRLQQIRLTLPDGSTTVSTGPLTTFNGMVSTRQPGGAALGPFVASAVSPVGDWDLTVPDTTVTALFDERASGLEDVFLVLNWSATIPAWR
jgi:hypothetical protein